MGELLRISEPSSIVLVPMTREEAIECVLFIRQNLDDARENILHLYEREGWKALGYLTWGECVKNEFFASQAKVFRVIQAERVKKKAGISQNEKLWPESALRELERLPDERLMESVKWQAESEAKSTGQRIRTWRITQLVNQRMLTIDKEPESMPMGPKKRGRPIRQAKAVGTDDDAKKQLRIFGQRMIFFTGRIDAAAVADVSELVSKILGRVGAN